MEAPTAPDAGQPKANDSRVTRQELHLRRVELRGYRRSDNLYEVEGRLVDSKSRDFKAPSGARSVSANDPIHDMGIRLVFDEQMTVHAIETFTDASPFPLCSEGGRALQSVVGLRMVSGWSAEVKRRLAGPAACTHLMELLMPVATVAFQTLAEVRMSRPQLDASGRPIKLDSCYAYGATREVVLRNWPTHYIRKTSES